MENNNNNNNNNNTDAIKEEIRRLTEDSLNGPYFGLKPMVDAIAVTNLCRRLAERLAFEE
jgi:hypothetical protein